MRFEVSSVLLNKDGTVVKFELLRLVQIFSVTYL